MLGASSDGPLGAACLSKQVHTEIRRDVIQIQGSLQPNVREKKKKKNQFSKLLLIHPAYIHPYPCVAMDEYRERDRVGQTERDDG